MGWKRYWPPLSHVVVEKETHVDIATLCDHMFLVILRGIKSKSDTYHGE
jgi:hypothetical protein